MELTNGVYAHIQETDKFKDVGISLRFMAPLDQEKAALRSLLAIMICDRCEAYPSKKAMSDAQDLLYGATLAAQTVGYGQAQVLEIRTKVIDPRYVEGSRLMNDVFDFLNNVLFHPLLNEDTLQESKAVLISKMQRMKDDPSQYVISKGLKLGGEGTALATSSLGELEQVEKITLEDVKKAHQELLQSNRIDLLICGAVQEVEILKCIKQHLSFQPRDVNVSTHYCFQKKATQEIIKEQRDITQCSIFMLWQTHTDICDSDYYALRLANAMFGQYPTSLLFQEVRERHSLCYSIYANLISFDGAMGVTTGVEKEHIDQAISLILEQFNDIRAGRFDDHLLEVSKTMMINSLKATKDTMNALMAQCYQNAVLKQKMSIDDRIQAIQQVTRDDVQAAFQKCEYQMSFVLCGKEESSCA